MSIALLAFIGGSACFGGGLLIAEPSGQLLGLSLSLIQTTQFESYLIPGIVLFGVIGVGSFFAMAAVIRTLPIFPVLVAADGAVITAWIIIQIAMIERVLPQQLIIGFIGLLLLGLGVLKWNHHVPEQ
jgi:hypothetical protein